MTLPTVARAAEGYELDRPDRILRPMVQPGAPVGRVGVIDVGSNTARLVVFERTAEGGLRSMFESKEVPRLGKGLGPEGDLSPEAVQRGRATLRRFALHLDRLGNPPLEAVATSAIRDAPNGAEFVARVEKDTGLRLRVISGEEEGRLAYLGVATAWELRDDLIIDLGGGSLQAVLTRRGRPARVVSLPLGALRLTQQFLRHDPPKRREIRALRTHVRKTLAGLPRRSGGRRPGRLFGVGGTIRCLARVAIESSRYPLHQTHGYELTRATTRELEELMASVPAAARRQLPGMTGHRADVIVAGIVVVQEVLRAAGRDPLVVSGTGIREGAAVDAAGIAVPATARALARRSITVAHRSFGFSLEHGDAVGRTALTLFARLRPRFGWTDADALALEVAAGMHDAGMSVAGWAHEEHSAYLLSNFPFLGIDHRQIALATLAVLQHEGSELSPDLRRQWRPVLDRAGFRTALELGAILSVAELLDGTPVGVTVRERTVHLRATHRAAEGLPPRVIERIARLLRRTFRYRVVYHER